MMKKLISLFHVRVEKDTIGGINDPRHAEFADQYEKEKTIEAKRQRISGWSEAEA